MVRLTEEEIMQILTYVAEDEDFQHTELLSIIGQTSGNTPDLDKLNPNPVDSGLCFPCVQTRENPNPPPDRIPLSQDWLVRAYPCNGQARVLMANTKTHPDLPNLDETRYGVAVVPGVAAASFSEITRDILLTVNGQYNGKLATNPHGILLVKDVLAIADFADDVIYFLKPNELDNATSGTNYTIDDEAFFDVQLAIEGADPDHMLPVNAHGQTMFMATNGTVTYIYMVYIVYDADAQGYPTQYYESIVVKLKVLDELSEDGYPQLEYVEQALTGLNTVGMALSTDENGVPILIMSAIGGIQQCGTTNGYLSEIRSLPAFESWAAPGAVGEAQILLIGDNQPDPGDPFLSHDIYVTATAYRGAATDKLHILSLMHHGDTPENYTEEYTEVDWEIYETTAGELAAMGGATISEAVDDGALRLIDSGTNDTRGPLWDIATEMGTVPAGDRRITLKGGTIEIAAIAGYCSKNPATFVTYERGYGPGQIGGMNVNSFTMTYQAILDALRGLQFKHTLHGILPEALRAAAKAEKAAKLAAAKPGLRALPKAATPAVELEEEGEEEDKK